MTPLIKSIDLAAREVAKNILMRFDVVRQLRLRGTRTSPAPSPDMLFLTAFRLPSICLKYAGQIAGKDVVEIGPGDHLATGLTFLALGAKTYTVLDRFPGHYSSSTAKMWYRLAQENFEQAFGLCWPRELDPGSFPEACRAVNAYAAAVENAPNCKADILCSHNVGEHVSDVRAFAEANKKMLEPDGVAIHVVDFSGHNWELDPHDPFLFRRFPSWLWNAMGSNRGYPNRVPFEEYLGILQQSGMNVSANDLKPFRFNDAIQEATFVCRAFPQSDKSQSSRSNPEFPTEDSKDSCRH